MNKRRIVCHHAFWFTLIGPLIGFISVIPLFYILLDYPTNYFRDIVEAWPTVLLLVYLGGSGPALLTGIISACLPKPYSSVVYVGMLGALLSTTLPFLIFIFGLGMSSEVFLCSLIAGLISAAIMQQIIPTLPSPWLKYSSNETNSG